MNQRIVMSPRARLEAKRMLVNRYLISCNTSGVVTVSRLAFSNHPRDWYVSSKIVTGQRYDHPLKDRKRTNVHIHACIPPQHKSMPFMNEATGFYNFTCGILPLPAPEGIDKLDLLCTSDGERGSVIIRTRWHFRFTIGNFTATVGMGIKHPVIRKTLEPAHQEYRQLCANYLAERLNPKTMLVVSGDGGPPPKRVSHANAMVRFYDAQYKYTP